MNRALALEARQASPDHELYHTHELIHVRAQRKEAAHTHLHEQPISLRVAASHERNHFMIQLERARFEFDTTWTYVKQESKIYNTFQQREYGLFE